MDIALIADDLTGACDAAIPFKMRGVRSMVHFDADAPQDARVQAFTTETRDLDENEVELKIRELAARVSAAQPRLIFKKIDSLLRGNPGLEIATALDADERKAIPDYYAKLPIPAALAKPAAENPKDYSPGALLA